MQLEWWLIAIVALLVVALAGWLHHAFWTWRLRVVTDYAELHRVATPDGSAIELRRLAGRRPTAARAEMHGAPAGAPTSELPPVILVHGLATSHRNHDVDPDYSLARHLEGAGRDVWLLTLRSGRADLRRAEARAMRFEAMVRHDIPLAIEQVLARTGAQQIDYVGFSMGGMLLYSAIERTVPARLFRRVAIIGSPARVHLPWRWLRVFRRVPRWMVPGLWLGLGARMAAFMADWFPTPIHALIYNRRNVARGAVPLAMVNAIGDIPGELQADLAEWALSDGPGDIVIDGEPVLDRLERVAVPALFFAGEGDRIAPPETVKVAFDRWGSAFEPGPPKEYRLLGRSAGLPEDYGHGDMVVGRQVREHLFVPLTEFLGETR